MGSNRKKLIELLSNHMNEFVSGEELSKQIGISRSAIWKHMNDLKSAGYRIESVRNRGYRITHLPSEISESSLRFGLKTKWLGHNLIHHRTVTSTQLLGHDLARNGAPHGTIVIADHQTEGRGRMRRFWHSEDKHGLWFTVVLRPSFIEPRDATQLTLVAAVALAEVMTSFGLNAKIKWPNDLLVNDLKLSGILTEMQAEQDRIEYILLGVGMNINQDRNQFPDEIKQKGTSVKMELGQSQELNDIFREIAHRFEEKYDTFIQKGFSPIKNEWETFAYRLNEWVTVKTKESYKAKFIGIQEDGALLIEDRNGKQSTLYSAEISW